MSRAPRFLRLVGWGAAALTAVVALVASGHGALAPPPLGSPGQWQAWFDQRDPATAAFALLRMATVGGCSYLAVVTVMGTVLRLARADTLVAVADLVTVAPVRRLLAGSVSLTLAGIGPTAMIAAAAQSAPPTTSVVSTTSTSTATSGSPASPPTTTPAAAVTGATPATVTMHRLPPLGASADDPPAPPAVDVVADRWTVEPGDCFWTIADDLLQRAWARPPTDAEIIPYWLRLIEANRSELPDPGNADLIYPGQIFTVPPLPPVGGPG